jgi:hypothetical protein
LAVLLLLLLLLQPVPVAGHLVPDTKQEPWLAPALTLLSHQQGPGFAAFAAAVAVLLLVLPLVLLHARDCSLSLLSHQPRLIPKDGQAPMLFQQKLPRQLSYQAVGAAVLVLLLVLLPAVHFQRPQPRQVQLLYPCHQLAAGHLFLRLPAVPLLQECCHLPAHLRQQLAAAAAVAAAVHCC